MFPSIPGNMSIFLSPPCFFTMPSPYRYEDTHAGPSSRPLSGRASLPWDSARKYAVLVDAGSSGSRMQVYSWKDPRIARTEKEQAGESVKVLPTVEKGTSDTSGRDWQLKVEPGLSSFADHPADLPAYLGPLFSHAMHTIPPSSLADTPVYVMATAGMRLLPPHKQDAILEHTCQYIQNNTPFRMGVGGCRDHVQIITGEEEGLLGWIAINYLMDGFHHQPSRLDHDESVSDVDVTQGQSTFGFLDMGGASTQIAFEPSNQAQLAKPSSIDDLTPVKLRMLDGSDVEHNVFVTTFLGYGTNKARERYLQMLQQSSNIGSRVYDPCLPRGLELPVERESVLVGTGDFDACLSSLSPLLDKNAECARPPCLFHGVHVPPIDFSVNHFIGVSEYWFSSNDIFQLGGVYDYVSFQKAAQEFCSKTWSDLASDFDRGTVFGTQVNQERLTLQCFKSAWMATVLHEGIGLPRIIDSGGKGDGKPHAHEAQGKADEKNLFQSVNDVNGLSVSWTLGKAVLEASKDIAPLPANGPHSAPVLGLPVDSPQPSTKWQDKFVPSWSQPAHALLPSSQSSWSGPTVGLFALLSMVAVGLICMFRGRSPKASRRRAKCRECLLAPFSSWRTQGEYVLADLEDGTHEPSTGTHVASDGDCHIALGSDSSGDDDEHFRSPRHKRRRSSGNSVWNALLIPMQRIALALGYTQPTSSHHHMRLPRRSTTHRAPMRHHATATPVSLSQPSSPKANGFSMSRPASRTGTMLSPRLHASNETASYFSHWQPSSASTATTSARSSRAGSPVFGVSGNGASFPSNHGNGRLTPVPRSAPGFARKAWTDE